MNNRTVIQIQSYKKLKKSVSTRWMLHTAADKKLKHLGIWSQLETHFYGANIFCMLRDKQQYGTAKSFRIENKAKMLKNKKVKLNFEA